jgi:hypothetical protein
MNQVQQNISDLIRLSTNDNFPGNQIVEDLQDKQELWNSYYGTYHNYTFPGFFSVYDPQASRIMAEHLHQIYLGIPVFNKLIIFSTGKNNMLLEKLAKNNWNCNAFETKIGSVYADDKRIHILIIKWY